MHRLHLPLDRDGFMRRLIGELSGKLQEVGGEEQASGFISLVGLSMGRHLNELYRAALAKDKLTPEEVGNVLVDLKRRIEGSFSIEVADETRIEMVNGHCPFAEDAEGHPSLCMMTSNVFGHITSQNLGYARVEIQEAIASGSKRCRVVVHLQPSDDSDAPGREYFGT